MPDTTAAEGETRSMNATPIRTVRVSDPEWEAAQATAYIERDTLATVIRFALTAYTKDPKAYWAAITAITHRELMSAEDLASAAAVVSGLALPYVDHPEFREEWRS